MNQNESALIRKRRNLLHHVRMDSKSVQSFWQREPSPKGAISEPQTTQPSNCYLRAHPPCVFTGERPACSKAHASQCRSKPPRDRTQTPGVYRLRTQSLSRHVHVAHRRNWSISLLLLLFSTSSFRQAAFSHLTPVGLAGLGWFTTTTSTSLSPSPAPNPDAFTACKNSTCAEKSAFERRKRKLHRFLRGQLWSGKDAGSYIKKYRMEG